MSTLAITIIAIQSIIILLIAYPAWLLFKVLSSREVMADLLEAKAKIDQYNDLSKAKPFTDEERMALSETVRESHKLKHPSKHKTVQWPTRPVPMPYDEIVTINWGKKIDVKGGKHGH